MRLTPLVGVLLAAACAVPAGAAARAPRVDIAAELAAAIADAQRGAAPTQAWVAPSCGGPDTDRDGRPDACDAFPGDPVEQDDTNGNGHGDNCDPDDDGDGVIDPPDAYSRNASETSDLDADGIGDNADPDVDGDGLRDDREAALRTAPRDRDSDDDGVPDGVEVRLRLAASRADSDRDGLPDGLELGVSVQVPRTLQLAGTDWAVFRRGHDRDPSTWTNPRRADTDRDGRPDGAEDANRNGRRDRGETDPLRARS